MHPHPVRPSRADALPQIAVVLFGGGAILALAPSVKALLGEPARSLVPPVLMLVVAGVARLVLRRTHERWADLGLRKPVSIGRLVAVIVAGYLAVAAVGLVVITVLLPALHLAPDPTGGLGRIQGDVGAYVYWLFVAWTGAAIGEELVFRGFLLTRLEALLGGGRMALAAGVVVQALLFGAAHGSQGLGGVILTGVTGVMLGLVYVVSRRSLLACMLLHALVDTVSLTAVFLGAA